MEDLKEKQDEIGLSISICIAVYGDYDDYYLMEKCLKLWEEVRKDFRECNFLEVRRFPLDAKRVKGRKMRGEHTWTRGVAVKSQEAYKETISSEAIEIFENQWIN